MPSSPPAAKASLAAVKNEDDQSIAPPDDPVTQPPSNTQSSPRSIPTQAASKLKEEDGVRNSSNHDNDNNNTMKGGGRMCDQPPPPQHGRMNASSISLPPMMYPYGPPPPLMPPHGMYPYGGLPQIHPRMPGPVAVGGYHPPPHPPPMAMHMPPHPAAAAAYGFPPLDHASRGGVDGFHPPMPPPIMMYPPPHHHHPYPQMMHYPHHHLMQPPQLVPSTMMGHNNVVVPTHPNPNGSSAEEDGAGSDGISNHHHHHHEEDGATSPEGSPLLSKGNSPNQCGQDQEEEEEEEQNDDVDGRNVEKDGNTSPCTHKNVDVPTIDKSSDIVPHNTMQQRQQQPSSLPMDSTIIKPKKQDGEGVMDADTNMTPTTCNTTLSQISPQGIDSSSHHHGSTSYYHHLSSVDDNRNNKDENTILGSTTGEMRMMLYPTTAGKEITTTTATPLCHYPITSSNSTNLFIPSASSSSFLLNSLSTTTPQAALHLLSSPYDSHGSFSAITTTSSNKNNNNNILQKYSSTLSDGKICQYPYSQNLNNHAIMPPLDTNQKIMMPTSSSHQNPAQSQYVYQYQHFDPRSHEDVPEEAVNLSQQTTSTAANTIMKHQGGVKTNYHHNTNITTNHHRSQPPSPPPPPPLTTKSDAAAAANNSIVPPTVHLPTYPGGYSHKDVSPLTTSIFSAVKNKDASVGETSSSIAPVTMAPTSTPDMLNFGNTSPILPTSELDSTLPTNRRGGDDNDNKNHVPGTTGTSVSQTSPLDLLSSVSTSPVMAHQPGKRVQHQHNHQQQHYLSSYNNNHVMHPSRQNDPSTYLYPPPPSQHASSYTHFRPGTSSHGMYYPEYTTSASAATTMPALTPLKPKQSNFELMLSAANTLDIDESCKTASKQHAKKRKLSTEVAKTIKKRLLVNNNNKTHHHNMEVASSSYTGPPSSSSTNLFSVGGYPPGFDFSTLPPSRLNNNKSNTSSKTCSNHKNSIDSESIAQAQQALQLAEQALERPRVGKQLLLSMALLRTNPRTPPSCYPAHGTILTDRFHWAAFPPLDSILRKNMERYYELSTNKCQSRDQQEFNNDLVISVKAEASKYGWEFDRKAFDDKKIRDRIRCFYKTHIQNAKKRLKTMLRHPEKRANIKALAAHFHLIEEKGFESEDLINTTATTAATTDDEEHCDDYDDDVDEEEEGNDYYNLGFCADSSEKRPLPPHHHRHHHQHHYEEDPSYGIQNHHP